MTETEAQRAARERAEVLAEAKRRDYDATFEKIIASGQHALDEHDPRKTITEQENTQHV